MYTNKQQTAQQIELVEAMNAITVLLLAITGTLALEIDYRNCGMARISKLELLGCSPKSIGRKCTVRRGETITLDAEFTPCKFVGRLQTKHKLIFCCSVCTQERSQSADCSSWISGIEKFSLYRL